MIILPANPHSLKRIREQNLLRTVNAVIKAKKMFSFFLPSVLWTICEFYSYTIHSFVFIFHTQSKKCQTIEAPVSRYHGMMPIIFTLISLSFFSSRFDRSAVLVQEIHHSCVSNAPFI